MFEIVPIVNCVPVDMWSVFPSSLHLSVGMPWRYSSTVAVQTSMCGSPAVVTGLGETDNSGGWRAVDCKITMGVNSTSVTPANS